MIEIINSNGDSLAYLENIWGAKVKEVINGQYTFSFSTIIEDMKTDYITDDNLVVLDGQIFQISIFEKERTSDNKLLVNVLAEHISYILIDDILDNFNYTNKSASILLNALLVDTDFLVETVNVGGIASFEIAEKINKREILNQIGNEFGGEFVFDNFRIDFLVQRGNDNGIEFRVGKNIKGIKKKIDKTKKDSLGNPYVTYEINVIELNELEEYKGLEGFSLGDTVKIIDDDLSIDIIARVLEYEYDPIVRKNSKVVFGNFSENITDSIAGFSVTSNLVSKRSAIWDRAKAISENGTFFSELIEGEINTLQNTVRAGLGSVTITDNNGILITDQPTIEASTKAIRLLGGVLAISNQKDVNGNFVYRTFGDGDGFVADYLIAGVINTDQISLQSADGKLNIVTNGITIEHDDGSKSILNASGLKVEHKIDDYSLFNADGFFRVIDGETLEYISAIRVGATTESDTNWSSGHYKIELRGKRWENAAADIGVTIAPLTFRPFLPPDMSWAIGYVTVGSKVFSVASITNVTNGVDVVIDSYERVGVSGIGNTEIKSVQFGYSIVLNREVV